MDETQDKDTLVLTVNRVDFANYLRVMLVEMNNAPKLEYSDISTYVNLKVAMMPEKWRK